jgi:haloalkane dehalogenase
LVPLDPNDPAVPDQRAAWDVLERFEKPWLCAFSDQDPVTAGGDAAFLARVPGTRGQPHTTIRGAGHFLQEDKGEELAAVVLDWLR